MVNLFQHQQVEIGGFIIEADRTANVTWRLFAGATEACPEYLIDNNHNLEWDDGTDTWLNLIALDYLICGILLLNINEKKTN